MKRNKLKAIFLHVIVVTIIGGLFCHGYIMGSSVSGLHNNICYAEADNWSSCDSSDLVTAFRYYCKSRNLAIEGSAADALTTFTTTTFNNLCSTLGIDPTSLQAELKKTTQGNLGLRFLFSNTGITAYNRIFAEFLQNNDLAVGDEVDNKVVYSQNVFIDDDGYKCVPYVINSNNNPNSSNAEIGNSKFVSSGTYYKYSHSDIYSGLECVFHINGHTYSRSIRSGTGSGEYWRPMGSWLSFNDVYYAFIGDGISDGNVCIIYNQYNSHYLLGSIGLRGNLPSNNYYYNNFSVFIIADITSVLSDNNVTDEDITITTNNNTINNNTYNNNYVIIYNDGDTYISDDDDEPLPTTPPGGGGDDPGGGDPDDWNPTVPDIPDPDTPDFPSIDLPDIDIPDLPSLDFSLGDLRNKFPFSLPFDIIAVLNVLDGEPQAPVIDATIPIGSWYTWEFHADFSEFDNYARLFRAFEFIGFVIGLAVFTVHFAKG